MKPWLCIAILLSGCGPKQPVEAAIDWAEPPRLPAPTAGVYTRANETPSDPGLASVVRDVRWDASLSGAAAGLALDQVKGQGGLYSWHARESAWQAGYPYPVEEVRGWNGALDNPPPPDVLAWLKASQPEHDVGLVRARADDRDVWIGLRAKPLVDIGPLPRQLSLGATLRLPAVAGAHYVVADANGFLHRGPLDEGASLPAKSMGEWLVRIDRGDQTVAMMPIYVGMAPPQQGFETFERAPASGAEQGEALFVEILEEIRAVYGASAPQRDRYLDAGAKSLMAGRTSDPKRVAAQLNVDPERMLHVDCTASTAQHCADRMLWSPENRAGLLSEPMLYGLSVEATPNGLHVVALMAPSE